MKPIRFARLLLALSLPLTLSVQQAFTGPKRPHSEKSAEKMCAAEFAKLPKAAAPSAKTAAPSVDPEVAKRLLAGPHDPAPSSLSQADDSRLRDWLRQYSDDGADTTESGRVVRDANGDFRVGDTLITGDWKHSLVQQKQHLGLTDAVLARFPRSAKVVSVGEGTSSLSSNLRQRFPDSKAIDIWYDQADLPDELRLFVERNRPHLIAASATRIPLPDLSVDLVVSHNLINNLEESASLALLEMVRILKIGGEARIAFKIRLGADFLPFLRKTFGAGIDAQSTHWQTPEGIGTTLVIRRLQ